jgi:hypothetical protein
MLNREIYEIDPSQHKLVNEGVANVNDDKTAQALNVLRYELETFVCDGRYQDGLERILDTYLANLNQAQQPGVWVSGFYGSGKSHLVKMLRALWENTEFPDGKKARDIAELPQSVQEKLVELNVQGRRYGSLHAASGTLGAGASGSVRLALLRIIFKSVGLPHQYPQARFVIWLRNEGILDAVRSYVENNDDIWEEELQNFYVAEGLHQALVYIRPNTFHSTDQCADTLIAQYPSVTDISIDDMVRTIMQALSNGDGIFPLTLIVLDEVQQYIGESSERSIDVQEAVEACCKNIGSNLLFIGTGQTAVTGTSNLKKLEGRFTVRVELSDTDVDSVIRKVVLAKKASKRRAIEEVIQHNIGEISRHLTDSTIGHRHDDSDVFTQDYPILPVRRRFWEQTLRVLDQTGTDSQLRNQLSMAHKAIQKNLDEPLGNVIAADYLYFDSADKLLQAHVLPRKVYDRTMTWIKGSPDERLMARASGIVFLLNKVAGRNNDLGIRADVDTIADLLVEDLNAGSSTLRSHLPELLESCELLIRVGDEYRIQTEESTAWNDEYQSQRNQLANESHAIESDRNNRIRQKFGELVPHKSLTIQHGRSKVSRDIQATFDSQLPSDANDRIYVWVRDGWSTDEATVKADARQAGNQSPTIFVFVPRRSADDLRSQLINYKATTATLNKRGTPNTPEGQEARASMQTIQNNAEGRIRSLLDEAFSGAEVFKGGGDEVVGASLQTAIVDAAQSSLTRLYPQFGMADEEGWHVVYRKAAEGAPDSLKSGVGHQGEPTEHPVCSQMMRMIGAGKKGNEIRNTFESAPYGWSRDAVDGALQALIVSGLVRAQDERGKLIDPTKLERRDIGKTVFKIESTTISTPQRIQIRQLLQKLGVNVKNGDELTALPEFLRLFEQLADAAGGEAPRPQRPDSSIIEPVRISSGNEQLMALYERREDIASLIDEWTATADRIEARLPLWNDLQHLLYHARNLEAADEIRHEVDAIIADRLLLDEPDPITPLGNRLYALLEQTLNENQSRYNAALETGRQSLEADPSWNEISAEQRKRLIEAQGIGQPMALDTSNFNALLRTLEAYPLETWDDRIGALRGRFDRAREAAARLLIPEAQPLTLPRRTLKSREELEAWLNDVKRQIENVLDDGPVILK